MNYKRNFIRVLALMFVLLLVSGCNLLGKDEELPTEEPTQATDEGEDTTVTTQKNDETTKKPDNTTKPNPDGGNDTPTPPASGTIKVACVGDSLTYGYGLTHADSYPTVLQGLLGSDYVVQNFGSQGRTMTLGLTDTNMPDRSYYDTDIYRESLAFDADIVVLCLGTNDAWRVNMTTDAGKTGYIAGLTALVNSYRDAGADEIYVCLPPDCLKDSSYANMGDTIETHMIPLLREQASVLNYQLIDLFTPTKDQNSYFLSDQVHFLPSGYAAMANAVYGVLSRTSSGIAVDGNCRVKDVYSFEEYLN